MNSKQQKLIIETLLASSEVFATCLGIMEGEYFDPEYRNAVSYIKDYASKYNAPPTLDQLNAKHDLDFKARKVTLPEVKSSCDDIEMFCKQRGLELAVLASVDDIESGNFSAMKERIDKASLISLQKDMGVDMFDDPEEYLTAMLETDINYSTGINALDEMLDGGLAKKQLTLFSANSGGGKSVMLSNLGVNYAIGHGMHVVYISLELAEPMIYKRNAFIMTGTSSKEWKEKISHMAGKIKAIKREGAGSFRVRRLPTGCSINDVRSFLKQYEMEHGIRPDVIIIDYLDLLSPNEGIKNMSISEQDKFKAEQYAQLLHDYNAIGISASQQNREALKTSSPDQSVIAGGMTKVNTVDNFISLFMDPALRSKGEMMAFFLKTRSSDGVGKMVMLKFDTLCLRIGDLEGGGMNRMVDNIAKRKKAAEADKVTGIRLDEKIDGLPGMPEVTKPAKVDKFLDEVEEGVKLEVGSKKRENKADLSKLTAGKPAKKTTVKREITALELLDAEEKITQYGKGEVETPPTVSNSGKQLNSEQEEFVKKHNLSKEAVEFTMSFMD